VGGGAEAKFAARRAILEADDVDLFAAEGLGEIIDGVIDSQRGEVENGVVEGARVFAVADLGVAR